MSILNVEAVHVYFGGVRALVGVNLGVEEGHIHGIIGPNGSGKTTLCNVISGFYRPKMGRVIFRGRNIGRLRPEQRIGIGLARTFQSLQIFGEMTVMENLMVGWHCRCHEGLVQGILKTPSARREKAEAMEKAFLSLRFVGLKDLEKKRANNLSFGQQRLLEFARALISEPKLLIVDEPAAGLSPPMVEHLTKLLQVLCKERGITIMVIEHVIRLVMGISNRITVLDNGERIAEGTPDEIRNDPRVIEAYLGTGVSRATN